MTIDSGTAAILTQSKSAGVAILLTLLFGGLGLFYASILGGLVITGAQFVVVILGVFTAGIGMALLLPLQLVAMVWAVVAVNSHNKQLVRRAQGA